MNEKEGVTESSDFSKIKNAKKEFDIIENEIDEIKNKIQKIEKRKDTSKTDNELLNTLTTKFNENIVTLKKQIIEIELDNDFTKLENDPIKDEINYELCFEKLTMRLGWENFYFWWVERTIGKGKGDDFIAEHKDIVLNRPQFRVLNYLTTKIPLIRSSHIDLVPDNEKSEKDKFYNIPVDDDPTIPYQPYHRDPFLRFTYDIIPNIGKGSKGIPFPLNCFVLSFLLLPLLLLPYFAVDHLDDGDPWKMIIHPLFFVLLVIFPIGLILMDRIYKKYKTTFKELRGVVKGSNEDYQKFIQITNWTFQSPLIYSYWVFILLSIVFSEIFEVGYYNETNVGLFSRMCFNIIWAVIWISTVTISWHLITLVRTVRRFCLLDLDIMPLHPDKAGGLKPLSNLTLSVASLSFLGMIALLYSVLVAKHSIYQFDNFSFLCMLIVFSVALFLMPLQNAHNAMLSTKTDVLQALANEHNGVYRKFRLKMVKPSPTIDEVTLTNLEGISKLYEKAELMPIWPFDFSILLKFFSTIIIPIILIFGSVIIESDRFEGEEENKPPSADVFLEFNATKNQSVQFVYNNQSDQIPNNTINYSYSDPDGDEVLIEWDFNGNGTYDWYRDLTIEWPENIDQIPGYEATHTFTHNGTYVSVFRVTDEHGAMYSATCVIKVRD